LLTFDALAPFGDSFARPSPFAGTTFGWLHLGQSTFVPTLRVAMLKSCPQYTHRNRIGMATRLKNRSVGRCARRAKSAGVQSLGATGSDFRAYQPVEEIAESPIDHKIEW
jgi:hypothetical protein